MTTALDPQKGLRWERDDAGVLELRSPALDWLRAAALVSPPQPPRPTLTLVRGGVDDAR